MIDGRLEKHEIEAVKKERFGREFEKEFSSIKGIQDYIKEKKFLDGEDTNILFDNCLFNFDNSEPFTIDTKFTNPLSFRFCSFNCSVIWKQKKPKQMDFSNSVFFKDLSICDINCEDKGNFSYSKFKSIVTFNKSHFGEVDFTGAEFYENADFKKINVIQRVNTTGIAKFKNVKFGLIDKQRNARLRFANISEKVDFTGAEFYGKAIFNSAQFHGEAKFSKVKFYGESNFTNSEFHGRTCFNSDDKEKKNTEFSVVHFDKATFNDYTDFKNIKFNDQVTFTNVKFKGYITFYGATFKNKVDFENSNFFDQAQFTKVTFKQQSCFRKTNFKKQVYFKRASFLRINIESQLSHFFEFTTFQSNAYFNNINNDKTIENIAEEQVGIINLENCAIEKNLFFLGAKINVANKETARIIKHEFLKINNQIVALEYHAKEMEKYKEELKESKDKVIWDKFILCMNNLSSKHGLSPSKGIMFTLITTAIIFVVFLSALWCENKIILDWNNTWETIKGFFLLLNVTNWSFELFGMTYKDYNIAFIVLVIGRIFIAYGIYQTIQAFRKFSRKSM